MRHTTNNIRIRRSTYIYRRRRRGAVGGVCVQNLLIPWFWRLVIPSPQPLHSRLDARCGLRACTSLCLLYELPTAAPRAPPFSLFSSYSSFPGIAQWFRRAITRLYRAPHPPPFPPLISRRATAVITGEWRSGDGARGAQKTLLSIYTLNAIKTTRVISQWRNFVSLSLDIFPLLYIFLSAAADNDLFSSRARHL